MFNKEGIPFFVIMIPFLSIIFIAFFSISYYMKITEEKFETDLKEYKVIYLKNNSKASFEVIEKRKREELEFIKDKYIKFTFILTGSILIFVALFSFMMVTIINDIVKKYVKQVENKERKLQNLNKNLASKVEKGIEEGKRKDKAILEQSKLARMGAMISMIAHQWRQPLTEISGTLMELETATRFKKVTDEHILKSIEKSDDLIEYMSNTIDDFRNFYKPDKIKESFFVEDSIKKAINLVNASLEDSNIKLQLNIKGKIQTFGYPTEFAQVILNLISNAKDILVERKIQKPIIKLSIEKKGINTIIKVSDNAGGIKEEYFDLIFDPYFSTKDSSKGTGLGLYISKLIIERNMGGELSVKNDNNGAVFTILLAN